MIKSFKCKETEKLFWEKPSKKFSSTIAMPAKIKLDMLDAAQEKQDLRIPPANHLEELKGNYQGYMSIRINNQFRVAFRFDGADAYDVHITDYH
ncbi:MAG: type II toxin-antitoxin system RelE/ParE family toxin [Sulfuricurvum sp.]|nr:type II toxin-antitoxin system RelE/ParE family toxin [Sulfuricurvum sp.]